MTIISPSRDKATQTVPINLGKDLLKLVTAFSSSFSGEPEYSLLITKANSKTARAMMPVFMLFKKISTKFFPFIMPSTMAMINENIEAKANPKKISVSNLEKIFLTSKSLEFVIISFVKT